MSNMAHMSTKWMKLKGLQQSDQEKNFSQLPRWCLDTWDSTDGRSRSCNMWEICRALQKRTLKLRFLVHGNNCRKRHLGPGILFCSFIIRGVMLLKLYQSSHRFFPGRETQNHRHEIIWRIGLKLVLVTISDIHKMQ